MENKYMLGETLTAWFTFSDKHKEVQAIGQVQSIRQFEDRPWPLYQLTGCDTPDGIFEAYENELTPTKPEDRDYLDRQNYGLQAGFPL